MAIKGHALFAMTSMLIILYHANCVMSSTDGTTAGMDSETTKGETTQGETTQGVTTEASKTGGTSPTNMTLCDQLAKERNKPTTTKKPECLTGWSCVNGECTAGMSCKCYEGWAGIFCQKECPTDCGAWGICSTNAAGEPTCVCNQTSLYIPGSGCIDKDDLNLTTTTVAPKTTAANLRPHEDRECFIGFLCEHGFCQQTTVTCVCDQGWRGDLCNEPCDIDCNDHGYCKEDDLGMTFCECEPDYKGFNCEKSIHEDDTTDSAFATTVSPQKPLVTDDSNFGDWLHTNRPATTTTTVATTTTAASTSTVANTTANITEPEIAALRSLEERTCFPGFVCEHGYCPKDSDFVMCVCDEGWSGHWCDEEDSDGAPPVLEEERNSTAKPTPQPGPPILPEEWPIIDEIPLPPQRLRRCDDTLFECAYGNCSRNGTKYICDCEHNFIGYFCQHKCPLNCSENSVCKKTDNGFFCDCKPRFTGDDCMDIFVPPSNAEDNSKWYAIGASIGGAILLALVAGLVLYVLWRRKNITAMKIVQWFQSYEDDDGRDYDGFVSYASADRDRQFVIQHLVPRLEGQLSFSLCIHQRNFMAGVYVTDGITDSIKKSRRTILVISPAFIDSMWCKFEYQVALQEMIAQKNRVLPIFIGDPEELKHKMDNSLKSITKSVTYLVYPGDDAPEKELELFWKRLALSMPKKRVSESMETSSNSTGLNLLDPKSKTLPNKPLSEPIYPPGDNPPVKQGPIIKVPFRSEDGKEIEFKQIVRVPAIELDPPDYESSTDKEMGCLARFFHGSDVTSSGGSDIDFSTALPTRMNGGPGYSNTAYEPDRNGYGQSSMQQQNNPQHPSLAEGYSPPKGNQSQYRPPVSDKDVFINLSDNFLGDQSLQRQLPV